MIVEPFGLQALLDGRVMLFSPAMWLGWVFRDRWPFHVSLTEPPLTVDPPPERRSATAFPFS